MAIPGAGSGQRARRHLLAPGPAGTPEAKAKRRIGVGFTGMGVTPWPCCARRYDSDEGRAMANALPRGHARCGAHGALGGAGAREGPSSKFDADGYLGRKGTLPAACPPDMKRRFAARHPQQPPAVHAPTGTVSLAFADNASNGIEPPFSWMYKRRKREADGSMAEYAVEDHSWRLYRELGGDVDKLFEYFVSAPGPRTTSP